LILSSTPALSVASCPKPPLSHWSSVRQPARAS
jgi:hypothetical protein